ncbi:MAG: chorismate mutase [Sphingomonadales bacterium]
MKSDKRTLEELRTRIDRLDDTAHDLFMERAQIVARIAGIKAKSEDGSAPIIRPDREALILRRLLDRHGGALSAGVIAGMWRTLIMGCVQIQQPVSVQLFGADDPQGLWDLARGHFGTTVPMGLQDSVTHVFASLDPDKGSLGVFPAPDVDQSHDWWIHLLSGMRDAPRIIAKLPVAETGECADDGLSGYVVGRMDPGRTGDDVTLIAVSTEDEVSRVRLVALFEKVELAARVLATCTADQDRTGWRHLIEVPQHITEIEENLANLIGASEGQLSAITVVGGHAATIRLTRPDDVKRS